MSNLAHIFNMFAIFMGIGLAVVAVLVVAYFRWKASGQERGI